MKNNNLRQAIEKEATYSHLENTSKTETENERCCQKELKEKKQEINKLKRLQKKTLQDLQETNYAIAVLAKRMEKNTEEKALQIARQLERKVLPFCRLLKEEGKNKETLNLEVDILTFQIKALVGELTHGSNLLSLLTPCEMHVSAMIARGITSQQIANQLFISESTVKTHRKNIRTKLGLKNKKTNLARYLIDIM